MMSVPAARIIFKLCLFFMGTSVVLLGCGHFLSGSGTVVLQGVNLTNTYFAYFQDRVFHPGVHPCDQFDYVEDSKDPLVVYFREHGFLNATFFQDPNWAPLCNITITPITTTVPPPEVSFLRDAGIAAKYNYKATKTLGYKAIELVLPPHYLGFYEKTTKAVEHFVKTTAHPSLKQGLPHVATFMGNWYDEFTSGPATPQTPPKPQVKTVGSRKYKSQQEMAFVWFKEVYYPKVMAPKMKEFFNGAFSYCLLGYVAVSCIVLVCDWLISFAIGACTWSIATYKSLKWFWTHRQVFWRVVKGIPERYAFYYQGDPQVRYSNVPVVQLHNRQLDTRNSMEDVWFLLRLIVVGLLVTAIVFSFGPPVRVRARPNRSNKATTKSFQGIGEAFMDLKLQMDKFEVGCNRGGWHTSENCSFEKLVWTYQVVTPDTSHFKTFKDMNVKGLKTSKQVKKAWRDVSVVFHVDKLPDSLLRGEKQLLNDVFVQLNSAQQLQTVKKKMPAGSKSKPKPSSASKSKPHPRPASKSKAHAPPTSKSKGPKPSAGSKKSNP